MDENTVWAFFSRNWVFKLYSRTRFHYVTTAIAVSTLPWIVGAVGSLLVNAFLTYVTNASPYLNVIGFALALIAFGWFARKLSYVLTALSQAFDISAEEYREIVRKWANRIANRNWLMVLASIPLAVLNLNDTIAIWSSSQPPIILEPWTSSSARLFFAVFYGFVHAGITPFLLGSGIVGLIGTMLLLGDLLRRPLNLIYYRRTEAVVELSTWLVMWTLVALSSVALFGRSIVVLRVNIPALDTSGAIQSILASVLAVSVGSIPLIQVRNAIAEAKRCNLAFLERLYERVYSELVAYIDRASGVSDAVKQPLLEYPEVFDDQILRSLYERLEIIATLIRQVESMPSLPIRWPSIARVSFGALLSIGSSIIREWLAGNAQWF